MDFKWIKQHPLSACSVGDIETIEDEERIAELKEGKFIAPYDPTTDTIEEVDPVKELQELELKYQTLVKENAELSAKIAELTVSQSGAASVSSSGVATAAVENPPSESQTPDTKKK